MNEEETAVLRLRAQGLSFRQIATRLGIPLTRAYKAAQQALGPEPDVAGSSGDDPPAEEAVEEREPEMVQTAAPAADAPQQQAAVVVGPTITLPVPEGATPSPGGIGYQLLTGPSTMPTREEVARGYTMPGPNGTTIVVSGGTTTIVPGEEP